MSLRARVARELEAGIDSTVARHASSLWEAVAGRRIARSLVLPDGLRVVGVGGATLGGAGKTPLAIALARALHERDVRAALVGHAYRASPRRARVVISSDPVAEVGDDALFAARSLGDAISVVVGPSRGAAIELAARIGASVAVVDGLLQASPRRVACSVLTLDGARPWGSGACPPAGDLRATRALLLAHSDVVAYVAYDGEAASVDVPVGAIAVPARVSVAGPQDALTSRCVGLLVAVARPGRVLASLRHLGIEIAPPRVVALADHAAPSELARAAASHRDVDVWLTTARCATKLPAALEGRPVLALDVELDVSTLVQAVHRRLFQPGG